MQLEEDLNPIKGRKGILDSSENPYGSYSTSEIKYQYMMGESILVAPMFDGEKSRDVLLPQGNGMISIRVNLQGRRRLLRSTPGLDRIPLFVKDGAIIPMLEGGKDQDARRRGGAFPGDPVLWGESPGASCCMMTMEQPSDMSRVSIHGQN